MDITFENEEALGILSFTGRLSAINFPHELEDYLNSSIEEGRINFILDLAKVAFVDSTGLSTLLTVLTKARNAGGEAVMINIPENLSNLLIVTKLNSIFVTKDSMEEARESFLIVKTK